METIKEIIVVEGKDDVAAVKRAVNCEIIITNGYGIREMTFKRIEKAMLTKGIIIFTDPDFAGERIRERISKRVKGCKHAFLSKEEATLKGNIGIENASPDSILKALKKVRTLSDKSKPLFEQSDMIDMNLMGFSNSAERRNTMGQLLGIGYCNAKQFLNRLNNYGVTREEFLIAIEKLEKR